GLTFRRSWLLNPNVTPYGAKLSRVFVRAILSPYVRLLCQFQERIQEQKPDHVCSCSTSVVTARKRKLRSCITNLKWLKASLGGAREVLSGNVVLVLNRNPI